MSLQSYVSMEAPLHDLFACLNEYLRSFLPRQSLLQDNRRVCQNRPDFPPLLNPQPPAIELGA